MTEQRKNLFALLGGLMILAVFFILGQYKTSSGISIPAGEYVAAAFKLIPQPEISAHTYIVKIVGVESPLLKQREWKKVAPASLTKMLTAVLAYEYLDPSSVVTFSDQAKAAGEKVSDAKTSEGFLRDDMLRLLLISSANDAAVALAEEVGRGFEPQDPVSGFVALMNEKADIIGMHDSDFKNPAGLDEDGHLSTAGDLAILAEYVWRHYPFIWQITKDSEADLFSDKSISYRIENTNKLLLEFPAIQGGKTGMTDRAKGALLLLYPVRSKMPKASVDSLANRTSNGIYPAKPDKMAIIVILGSDDRFGDGRKIIEWLEKIN